MEKVLMLLVMLCYALCETFFDQLQDVLTRAGPNQQQMVADMAQRLEMDQRWLELHSGSEYRRTHLEAILPISEHFWDQLEKVQQRIGTVLKRADTFGAGAAQAGDEQQAALYHLNKRLIVTRNPEEIRGGGLLKYCHLLTREYSATANGRDIDKYMCSRFFINFPQINVQEMKLLSYLQNHFSNRNDNFNFATAAEEIPNWATIGRMHISHHECSHAVCEFLVKHGEPVDYVILKGAHEEVRRSGNVGATYISRRKKYTRPQMRDRIKCTLGEIGDYVVHGEKMGSISDQEKAEDMAMVLIHKFNVLHLDAWSYAEHKDSERHLPKGNQRIMRFLRRKAAEMNDRIKSELLILFRDPNNLAKITKCAERLMSGNGRKTLTRSDLYTIFVDPPVSKSPRWKETVNAPLPDFGQFAMVEKHWNTKSKSDLSTLLADIQPVSAHDVLSQPLGTDVNALRAQQELLKMLKNEEMSELADRKERTERECKELIKGVGPGISTDKLVEAFEQWQHADEALAERMATLSDAIAQLSAADVDGAERLGAELDSVERREWAKLDELANQIVQMPNVEQTDHLTRKMRSNESQLARIRRDLAAKLESGEKTSGLLRNFRENAQKIETDLAEVESQIHTNLSDVSSPPPAPFNLINFDQQRHECKALGQRLITAGRELKELEELGSMLIQSGGIGASKRRSTEMDESAGGGAGLIGMTRQLFELHRKKDELDRALMEIERRIERRNDERQKWETDRDALNAWLEQERARLASAWRALAWEPSSMSAQLAEVQDGQQRLRHNQHRLTQLKLNMDHQTGGPGGVDQHEMKAAMDKLERKWHGVESGWSGMDKCISTAGGLAKEADRLEKWVDSKSRLADQCVVSAADVKLMDSQLAIAKKDNWQQLASSDVERKERELEATVQALGSFREAQQSLLNWLEQTEQLIADQNPPSTDYKGQQ